MECPRTRHELARRGQNKYAEILKNSSKKDKVIHGKEVKL